MLRRDFAYDPPGVSAPIQALLKMEDEISILHQNKHQLEQILRYHSTKSSKLPMEEYMCMFSNLRICPDLLPFVEVHNLVSKLLRHTVGKIAVSFTFFEQCLIVKSLKKRLVLLLSHCEEGAAKVYGVKLAVKPLKGHLKDAGGRKFKEVDKAEYLKKVYQTESANMSLQLHTGVTLKPKLWDRHSNKYSGLGTSIDMYRTGSRSQNRASSLEPKKMHRTNDISSSSSYATTEASRIYQQPKSYLQKLAATKCRRKNARSLSSNDKRRLDTSLTKELPPLYNPNPPQSVSAVTSTIDLDHSSIGNKNTSFDIHRVLPKMLQTIENEPVELRKTPQSKPEEQRRVATSLSEKSDFSATEGQSTRRKVNRIRLEISARRGEKLRSKSQVMERSPTEDNKVNITTLLKRKLLQIKKAFSKFKAKHAKLDKTKITDKSRQEKQEGPITENSSATSSVYNTITIFTHNAISNNIKIVKDPDKEEAKTDRMSEPESDIDQLRRELELYKKKAEGLEKELQNAKEKLKKYEYSAE